MKKQLYILILLLLPVLGWGQLENFTLHDSTSSILIVPEGIKTTRPQVIGKYNTAIGEKALVMNSYAEHSTAMGFNALRNNGLNGNNFQYDGFYNCAFGSLALRDNTKGSHNTAIGYKSLVSNNLGRYNISIGSESLTKVANSNYNIGIGYQALTNLISGNQNMAIGFASLLSLSLNSEGNIGVGNGTLAFTHSGNSNTTIGINSIGRAYNAFNNTVVGASALFSSNGATVINNVAVGSYSLYECIGSNNIAIGTFAGRNETGSDKLYIENSNSSTPLIGGDFANDIVGVNMPIISLATNPTWKLQVGGDINASGSVRAAGVVLTSDVRFKKDIEQLTSALGQVMQLRGVSYYWNQSKFPTRNFTESKQMGLIAQEIEKIFPEIVETDAEGYKSVNYVQLTPVMIEAIKELNNKVVNLEKQNLELKASISGIYEMLNKQEVNSSKAKTSK